MKALFTFIILTFSSIAVFSQTNNQFENQNFNPDLFKDGVKNITIYYRNDCGRCADIMNALDNADIKYEKQDYNIEENQKIVERYIYKTLPDKSMGYAVKFPLIMIDDVLYFSIANHQEFITQLIQFIKEQ